MTWQRVVNRNNLQGDYRQPTNGMCDPIGLIAGDMRRLEQDQRDETHLAHYAEKAGITSDQAKTVLDLLFGEGGA